MSIESFLHRVLGRFKHMVIYNCFRDKYLTRWYLVRNNRLGVFLHLFHHSDEDRALHDHPWSFVSIILWRGYIEHTGCKDPSCVRPSHQHAKRKWPGMILFRPAEWRHRVELVDGRQAISLIIRFNRRRVWGYWFPSGFIAHDKWWEANCE